VAVQAEAHHVPYAERHVRLDAELLRHVPDRGVAVLPRGAVEQYGAFGDRLEAEDDLEQGGLARAVRPDEPGELAGTDAERDVFQYLAAAQPDTDVFQPEQVVSGHRCSVDWCLLMALRRAWTSASIQDW
jgi:hypothetical protein